MTRAAFCWLALLLPTPVIAQAHQHELGTVTFPVTCNAAAQTGMNQAVSMLHSFWFPEARKTFESVVQADAGCGIAYWGIAMTHFGNLMAGGGGPAGQKAGWDAVEQGLRAGARSARDSGYLAAAVALFKDHATVDNRTRMVRYEQALKEIVDRNASDTEAVIFYNLARVANAPPTDLTFAQQQEAARTLTALYEKQPNHPGLAHYIIHAFDSPPLARHALAAARQYAGIAPAAPHALHMPSHIFTRLGYWDESIATNRKSADLEPTPGGKAHPLDYMVYGYLQQGRDDQAQKAIEEIGGNVAGEYISGTLGSYNALAMPARFALERNEWRVAAALKVAEAAPSARAVTHFARGIGAGRSGDAAAAKGESAALAKLASDLTTARETYWAHVVDAQRMAVDAWAAHAEGRHGDAERLALEAATKEELVEKHPVTPGPLLPARELYGDLLMIHGKPADALAAFEKTLEREPNRLRALVGAARAAKAAARADVARKHYQAIIALVAPSSSRPELAEAKAFVANR